MDSEPQKSPWALCRVCNAMSGIIWEFSEEGVCGRDSNDWSLWDSEVTREQIICRSKLDGLKHTSKRSSVYQNLKQTLKHCRLKCPTLKSQNKGRPRCSSSISISKKKRYLRFGKSDGDLYKKPRNSEINYYQHSRNLTSQDWTFVSGLS